MTFHAAFFKKGETILSAKNIEASNMIEALQKLFKEFPEDSIDLLYCSKIPAI